MTSRTESIEKIELHKRGGLAALIEETIGVGIRDWRDTKWGDGKLHVSFTRGKYPESEITSVCNDYTKLGWTISRTSKSTASYEDHDGEYRTVLLFE